MSIKGYKVFNPDWTCEGFQFEVGKTFKHKGSIEIYKKGFHFCQKASDCFNYYSFDSKNKVAEIEAIGLVETDGTTSVTDQIKIVREISWSGLLTIVNNEKDNSGNWNTGDGNTGRCNTSDYNTGNYNTGDYNTGDYNTGDRNTGHHNTGNCNIGNWNTGDCNTGCWNTGDYNTGDYNTGDCNTGYWNTGDWNSADFSPGFFNSTKEKIRIFNHETDLSREDFQNTKGIKVLNWNFEDHWWIYSEYMTEEEKNAHPEHEITGGYLKTVDFKTACKIMWNNLNDEDKQAVKEIPNFDADVFEEITGIRV